MVTLGLLACSIASAQSPAIERAMRRFAGVYRKATVVTRGFEPGNPKVDPTLRDSLNGEVAVEMTARDDAAAVSLADAVRAAGGRVTATFEGTVFAIIPVAAIDTLAASDSLSFMGRQPHAMPQQEIISKAPTLVDAIGAGRLQSVGITGRGVRVGIIDFGFARYNELELQGKLPKPAGLQLFTSEREARQEEHGTGCAEIIHRMAPEAELYLAAAGSDAGSIIAAAQWLLEQHVGIISFSGGMFEGPHDGSALLDRFVDHIVSQGVLWVNSSGNGALDHWMGSTRHHDQDGWLLFSNKSEQLLFFKASSKDISVEVVWDDWGQDPHRPASTQAVHAFLFGEDRNGDPQLIASRRFDSSAHAAPAAHFERHGVAKDSIFALGLNVGPANRYMRDLKVHVFTRGFAEQFPVVTDGSVNIPATAHNVLSVGAVNIRNGEIEPFSSRGPTDDGRPKPELVAYDNMALSLFPNGFEGTSAACPHAAGLAALLSQIHPELRGLALRQAVLKYVRPPRGGVTTPAYGLGILDAARMPLPGQETPRVQLPASLGGGISVDALEQLRSVANDFHAFDAKVALHQPQSVYHYNQALKLSFRTSVQAHYVILDRDSSGAYAAVLPGSMEDRSPLDANRDYVYPANGVDRIRITPPEGHEELILICASEPLKLEELFRHNRDELKRKLSISIVGYEVRP